jgi:hypothetical protein
MNDSTAKLPLCSRCGDEVLYQYFYMGGKILCRKCWTASMLQASQYLMITEKICTCDGPVEISVCSKCGKAKYDNHTKRE